MSEPIFRLLVVDDNPRIHDDFRKIFRSTKDTDGFDALKQELFGSPARVCKGHSYELDYHLSGQVALDAVKCANEANRPYSVAFIDMRMPGWDGIETTLRLWELDPDIQIVICTAYMDHSWESIVQQLGEERSFLILKKPFEVIEVKQLAQMLSSKWMAMRTERETMADLGAALRAKDIFMARVSHELRTPLHGIIGVIDLMKETRLDAQQLEFLQTLNSCGENLDRIIDDILDYSALEDGRFQLQVQSFDLAEFIGSIRKQFRFETVSRGIELLVNLDPNLPQWVKGDTTRLHQIVGNLLRNAFKFTEEGEVTLSVQVGKLESDRIRIEVEVCDTGVGIPEPYMRNLFVPFSQAENVNRRRFGGNGLGLAICKAIIESMDGSIEVSSEVGLGTSVRFDLCLGLCTDQECATLGSRNDTDVVHPAARGLKILAVDDSRTNRKVIQNQLFWLGHRCQAVGGCEEALECLAAHSFDFIFMDCQMPGVDGFETTERIRSSLPQYRDVPIVALTANIDRSTQERCERVGMNGFVSKPARRADLQRKIDELMHLVGVPGSDVTPGASVQG